MKKSLFIGALLLLGAIGVSHANQDSFRVPRDINNIPNPSMEAVGVEKCYLITSTTPALVTDRSGTTMTNGLIYWVIAPSTAAAVTVYAEFRDTATANGSSASLFPRIGTSVNGAAGANPQMIKFDPPIPFYNGLSVNLLPAAAAPGTGIEFAVGIRWKRQ